MIVLLGFGVLLGLQERWAQFLQIYVIVMSYVLAESRRSTA